MYRLLRTLVLASTLIVPLSACSSMGDFSVDPTEWLPDDLFGNKKKLPGERRAIFPQGVPGVERGVPPDLVKGAQPSADMMSVDAQALTESNPTEPPPEEEKPKAKPKPKPKPKVAAKPAPVEPQPRATPVTARPPMQQPSAGGGTQWPSAPAPSGGMGGGGGRPSGGVQWPDP